MAEEFDLEKSFYKIAMSVGIHLDLDTMCTEVALVTLKELNCIAFIVFEERRIAGDEFIFLHEYAYPDDYARTDNFQILTNSIPQNITRQKVRDFYSKLPLNIEQKDGGGWYIMHLPKYGLLGIYREKPFSKKVLEAFEALNKRLAAACLACRDHKHLVIGEKRYKLLLETMEEGVAAVFPNNIVSYVNDGFCRLLGYTVKQMKGKSVKDILDDKSQKVYDTAIKTCLKTGTTQCEMTWTTSDGEQLETLISLKPTYETGKDFTGYLMVVTDLTSQKQAEKRFAQLDKMQAVGALAGGIAHDFNNMLAVILGNLSLAQSSIDKSNEISEYLNDIEKATKQAQSLTKQLLTFSKGGDPVKESKDVNKIIKETAEFVLRGSKVQSKLNLCNDPLVAKVDIGQITQVLSNLLINAKQSMPNGGKIKILSEKTKLNDDSLSLALGEYIKIRISDQGSGIPEENLNHIFEPFFTTKKDGNGLGLATAFSIIHKHGGTITVHSEMNKGTIFDIYLPLSFTAVSPSKDETYQKHTGKGRVLLMDDNKMMIELLVAMLEKMGYDSVATYEGSEAVAKYGEAIGTSDAFDIVILDLTVPGGMGGGEAISKLKKIDPNVKAIVSSGYSNDPILSRHTDYGFCGVVSKPYSMEDLAAVLNGVIG